MPAKQNTKKEKKESSFLPLMGDVPKDDKIYLLKTQSRVTHFKPDHASCESVKTPCLGKRVILHIPVAPHAALTQCELVLSSAPCTVRGSG